MAIEDVLVLARCLGNYAPIRSAFEAFDRVRRNRVERIVAAGARTSSTKTPGVVGRLVRDAMLKVLLRFVVTEKSVSWMYDYRINWSVDAPSTTGVVMPTAALLS